MEKFGKPLLCVCLVGLAVALVVLFLDVWKRDKEVRENFQPVSYLYDNRTNLCFARDVRFTRRGPRYGNGMAAVPCTPEVMKLAEPVDKG